MGVDELDERRLLERCRSVPRTPSPAPVASRIWPSGLTIRMMSEACWTRACSSSLLWGSGMGCTSRTGIVVLIGPPECVL